MEDLIKYLNIPHTTITKSGKIICISFNNEIQVKRECETTTCIFILLDDFKYIVYRHLQPKMFKSTTEINSLSTVLQVKEIEKEIRIRKQIRNNEINWEKLINNN